MKMYSRILLASFSGVLYFVAFVGFDQFYLAWICLIPLFFALEGVSPKQGLFIGWLFGTVALIGGFYWVTYTIHVFAFMPWAVGALGCVLLNIAQATQFAAFGLVYAYMRGRSKLSPVLLATVVFVAAEFICPQLFPHYFGNSQYLWLPIIQIADITGVAGVSALLVFVNAALFSILSGIIQKNFKWKLTLSTLIVVTLCLTYGYFRISSVDAEMNAAEKVRFGITQANMGIYEKAKNPGKAIKINQEMTRNLKAQGAEIVVWPESAFEAPVLSEGDTKLPDVVFDNLGVPILTGAIQRDFTKSERILYNVAVLSDEAGNIVGKYNKQKLLMFGEYIPLGKTFPILHKWMPYIGRFQRGHSNKPIKFRDYSFSVNICYEEILPRLINKMLSYPANVIVNITNDNWFGKTTEPMQHLVLAAFRSVEHRRWLVRSTNTGISCFVDAAGRILEKAPLMMPATLIRNVPMMTGETFYSQTGDWFSWLSVFTVFGLAITKRKNKKK